jgi:hypothetical protein
MNRKEFLRHAAYVTVLLTNGQVLQASDITPWSWAKRKVVLRFAVASDGHYGEKNTLYEAYFDNLVNRVNQEHADDPFAFCMINGDIIHDDKQHFPAAKAALDKLVMKYYVSQGNHDHASPAEWSQVWSMPVNHDFSIRRNSFLIATTSDEAGTYLCPDVKWIESKLEKYRKQQNVFLFLHINPGKLTKYGVDCPELFEIFSKYPNIKAVFNGHDHDEEGIRMRNNIPFIFDAHFGGSWGTTYRGFRVVELLKDNSLATYILDPMKRINEMSL